ncbi:MAG: hypothetical protein ABJM36_08270 [Algibacter sp.]|uniref:hypothetical protein n=1 Tax=Algibacter sp. TaxID=1872428 RepID=UPI003297F90A
MRKEYRIAKGWEIFIWICFPVFMILFFYLGIMPYLEEKVNVTLAVFLTLIALGLEFLMVLGLIDTRKNKLIIEKESITSIGVFKTKTLAIKNVKGFKVDRNYLWYFSENENEKKIKVSRYVGGFDELLSWSEQHFNDLDLEEFKNDEQEILENREFGMTAKESEHNLLKAKKTTKIINIISWIVALSTWFYPRYYQIQIILCAVLPIIGLIIFKNSKGLIRLDEKPNSPYPNIHSTLIIPSLTLLIRALTDFEILDYSGLWIPVSSLIMVIGFLIMNDSYVHYNFKKGHTYLTVFGVLILAGSYGYGLLITTNAAFEDAEPIVYDVGILNKRISSGKSTSYYFELEKWGPHNKIDEVSVSKNIYNSKEVGDKAVVCFNTGLYKIPYYFVIQ